VKGRTIIINLLILCGIIGLGAHHVSGWESFQEVNSLRQLVSASDERVASVQSFSPGAALQGQPFSDFMVISEKNLFAEDRQPEAVEENGEEGGESSVEETPPKWASRPLLHGVSLMEGKKQAMMTVYERRSSKGIEGDFKSLKEGSTVQGYRLAEIGETTVTLKWKDISEVIEMSDAISAAAKPAPKAGSQTVAVKVVKVGSALPFVSKTGVRATDQQESSGVEVAVVSGQGSGAQGGAARQGQAVQTQQIGAGVSSTGTTSQALRSRRGTQ